jgi:hypothetical protein
MPSGGVLTLDTLFVMHHTICTTIAFVTCNNSFFGLMTYLGVETRFPQEQNVRCVLILLYMLQVLQDAPLPIKLMGGLFKGIANIAGPLYFLFFDSSMFDIEGCCVDGAHTHTHTHTHARTHTHTHTHTSLHCDYAYRWTLVHRRAFFFLEAAESDIARVRDAL